MVDERFRPFVIPPRHPARQQLQTGWDLYLAIGREHSDHPGGVERIEHVVFALLVRVWRLYRSALTLAVDGFGPESESMARAMYEANLTALWAVTHPDEAVARFDLHLTYSFHLNYEQQEGAEPIDPMDPDDRARAVKWFGKYGELPWCGEKIRDLDAQAREFLATVDPRDSLAGYLNSAHRWMNWSLHGSPINVFRVTRVVDSQRVFDVAPSELDILDAMRYCGTQLILSVVVMLIHYGAQPSRTLQRAIFEVWRSLNPESYTTGRNDPCLCGSGLKYKRCHLLN